MDLATILNPSSSKQLDQSQHHPQHHCTSLHSPPISPKRLHHGLLPSTLIANMKPRSRFSALEDAIICQGVAKGLTWGQISGQLPHRKRATCFNRYRTLQGVRKSRAQDPPFPSSLYYYHHHHRQCHDQQQQQHPSYDNFAQHYYYSSPPASTKAIQWLQLPSPPPSSSPTLTTTSVSPCIDANRQKQHTKYSASASPLSIPSILHHSRHDSALSSNAYHYRPY